jgi:hypothetical protein
LKIGAPQLKQTMTATSAPDAVDEQLYTPKWECCVCLEELGRKRGLLPCLNTRCPDHGVCYACVQSLPRANGQTLCPLCRAPCGEFVPLANFVDTTRDPEAAEMLRAAKRARTATTAPAFAPVASRQPAIRIPPVAILDRSPAGSSQSVDFIQRPTQPAYSSAIPVTIMPEVVPPWNAPHLREARQADLLPLVRAHQEDMRRSKSNRNFFWHDAVPAYDVPYILRNAQGEPLPMRQQTTLHAIQADAIAAIRPLCLGSTFKTYLGFDRDWPGVYYMLFRQQPLVPDPLGDFSGRGAYASLLCACV